MLDKRYDHKAVEEGKYENWKSKGYFTAGDKGKQPFSIVIPPPNVTGKLHLGHVMDTVPDDITARYKRMKGFDVLWVPGVDHAGIATQAKVEERLRKQGISRYDLGREKFLEVAFSWKEEYSKTIHQQWASIGLSVDYTRERFTLDPGLSKAVLRVFKTLYDEGLIYRGERIINWDPELCTALSNIEVVHSDDQGEFFYFLSTTWSARTPRSWLPPPARRRCSATSPSSSTPRTSAIRASSARRSSTPPMARSCRSWPTPTSI